MVYTCELCDGNYESLRRLHIHQSLFKKRFIRNNVITTSLTDGCEYVSDAQIETADILLADEFFIEKFPKLYQIYPTILKVATHCFSYHEIPGETFANLINDLYNEIVTWKKNLCKLPTGSAAEAFIKDFRFGLRDLIAKQNIITLH